MGSYETSTDGLRAWGTTCRPDYDILQARAHLAPLGIVEDPQTHDIAVLHLGGTVLPIRPAGSGHELSFRIGDQVDLGQKLLPAPPSEGSLGDGRVAGVDEHGRLWISSMYTNLYADAGPVDHWLYAVHLPGLFEPAPVILPATPGESVTVQAEHTLTTSTRQRPGGSATVQVDSDAYLLTCLDLAAAVGCAYDGVAGNGFVVGDDSGYGHLSGPLEYRIEAPSAGQYRISYRVSTFAITTDARIELSLGDRRRLTAVSTGGGWRTVEVAEAVTVPAGPQRLILSVPDGGGGWYLNSFRLQRV